MKEETLLLPIFLLLPFYRQEGKEKQDGNIDFGFVKYLKNAKSFEHTIRLCKSFDWAIENFTSGRNFAMW